MPPATNCDELAPMNKLLSFNTKQVLDAAHDYWLASKRRNRVDHHVDARVSTTVPEHCAVAGYRLNHYGDNWPIVNLIPLNHRGLEVDHLQAGRLTAVRRFLHRGHHRHTA